MKQQKKQLKKEQIEREEAIKEKLKESQKVLAVLNHFGDETIRNDFLNELNGATKLNEQELNALDEFNKLVQPSDDLVSDRLDAMASDSAEHLFNLIEGKNKQIAQLSAQVVGAAFTYADLKKLFERILTSSYWQKQQQQVQNGEGVAAESHENVEVQAAELGEQISHLNIEQGALHHHNETNAIGGHSNMPLDQGSIFMRS